MEEDTQRQQMNIEYYIDSQVCKGIQVENDLYIESELVGLDDEDLVEN